MEVSINNKIYILQRDDTESFQTFLTKKNVAFTLNSSISMGADILKCAIMQKPVQEKDLRDNSCFSKNGGDLVNASIYLHIFIDSDDIKIY